MANNNNNNDDYYDRLDTATLFAFVHTRRKGGTYTQQFGRILSSRKVAEAVLPEDPTTIYLVIIILHG